MPLMAWNDKLSVGVKVLDDDHKKLLAIANELYDAIVDQRGKDVLGGILDRLVSYTQFHLAREEQFFAVTGYPDAVQHTKIHEALTKQALDIQERLNCGTQPLTLEVMTFLKDWLFDHILGADAKYGPYLNSKGIS
jgi:hemerythrin-like metal-binding protein